MRGIKKENRKFGLELEFSSKIEAVRKIVEPVLQVPNFYVEDSHSKSNGRIWHLKTDSSTESELATPIMTLDSPHYDKFIHLIKTIKSSKLRITRNDSVHVHIHIPDIRLENLVIAWIFHERQFMNIFPPHRRNGTYTAPYAYKPRRKNYFNLAHYFQQTENTRTDHHQNLSFFWYEDRKTVEFRMMEGTLDERDIQMWLSVIMQFLEYAKTIDTVKYLVDSPMDGDKNLDFLDMRALDWTVERIHRFDTSIHK
jgi:hypothetical protein